MSIKKLINALFQLRGSRAMPNYNGQISGVTLVNEQTVVSPVNGYLRVHGEVSDNGGEDNEVNVTISSTNRIVTTQGKNNGNWIDFLFPVQKGVSYEFGFLNIQTARYDIFPLVGGGLRALLRKLCRGFGEVCYVC